MLDDDDGGYNGIMDDISENYYGNKPISPGARQEIIQKAKILSGETDSARCLFLLLVTNAYLRDEPIRSMNTEKLMKIYIERSKKIFINHYPEEIADIGYLVLAYVTACGGIKWEERPLAIQKKLEYICDTICRSSKKKKNLFFSLLSESENKGMILPLKPDLIGEYLFLTEWDDFDNEEEKEHWLPNLLKHDYGNEFLARCLTNWHNAESERLCEAIKDIAEQQADGLTNYCAEVFGKAFQKSNSENERQKYFDIIDYFSKRGVLPFMKQHANALPYMIKSDQKKYGYTSEHIPAWEFNPETREEYQDGSDNE